MFLHRPKLSLYVSILVCTLIVGYVGAFFSLTICGHFSCQTGKLGEKIWFVLLLSRRNPAGWASDSHLAASLHLNPESQTLKWKPLLLCVAVLCGVTLYF